MSRGEKYFVAYLAFLFLLAVASISGAFWIAG